MDEATKRKLPEVQITVKKQRLDGTVSVSGGRDLKAIQAYPRLFGIKVAECYHNLALGGKVDVAPLSNLLLDTDDWEVMQLTLERPPGI